MSLSDHPLNASVAVSDMAAATEFYEGKLGLVPARAGADGSKVYPSGGAVALHVYPSPEHAGKATATLVTWYVDDVGKMVDELTANGGSLPSTTPTTRASVTCDCRFPTWPAARCG